MNIGITRKTSRKPVVICFKEWIRFLGKKKGKKNGKSEHNQGNSEIRANNLQGQADRENQTEFTADVHYFAEP